MGHSCLYTRMASNCMKGSASANRPNISMSMACYDDSQMLNSLTTNGK